MYQNLVTDNELCLALRESAEMKELLTVFDYSKKPLGVKFQTRFLVSLFDG